MKMHVRIVAILVGSVLLLTLGCGGGKEPEPEEGVWDEGVGDQGQGSGSEGTGENPPKSADSQQHSAVLSLYSRQPLFRFVAMQDNGQPRAKNDDDVHELCVRLAGCEIPEDSPKRKDNSLNQPPNLYVIVKRAGSEVLTSAVKSGWQVAFPATPEHEFDISGSNETKYYFQVWDDQWTDQRVTEISMTEKDLFRRVLASPSGDASFTGKKSQVSIKLERVGILRWYRLASITIPPDAPCRAAFQRGTPQLEVRLLRDGKELPSKAGKTRSICLAAGWEGTFPKDARHCWRILEQSDAKYDVAVWDLGWRNQHLFTRGSLRGEEFNQPVLERVPAMVADERAARVLFERLTRPIED